MKNDYTKRLGLSLKPKRKLLWNTTILGIIVSYLVSISLELLCLHAFSSSRPAFIVVLDAVISVSVPTTAVALLSAAIQSISLMKNASRQEKLNSFFPLFLVLLVYSFFGYPLIKAFPENWVVISLLFLFMIIICSYCVRICSKVTSKYIQRFSAVGNKCFPGSPQFKKAEAKAI